MIDTNNESQYLKLARAIHRTGRDRDDRTGTGTRSLFGRHLSFDLRRGFPALTVKKLNMHAVVTELLWFLRGDTDTRFLHDHGVKIWDEWADDRGYLGPVYGAQWRRWRRFRNLKADGQSEAWRQTQAFDQVRWVLNEAERNPTSRRLLVSAWNVADLEEMALPPCHLMWQLYCADETVGAGSTVRARYLDLVMFQRSADVFLGLPFDVASYATLMHIIGRVLNRTPRHLHVMLGDAHLYQDHRVHGGPVDTMLSREPYRPPTLRLSESAKEVLRARRGWGDICPEFDLLRPDDFSLDDYSHHPFIKAQVSV